MLRFPRGSARVGYNQTVIDNWKAIITARGGTPVIPAGQSYNRTILSLVEQAITASGGTPPTYDGRDWNSRHLQLLDHFSGLSVGTPLSLAFTDMVSSGSWVDPGGNHLSGVPSFSSGAWSLDLLGGAGTSVSDPLDGAHIIGPALTNLADGDAFTTTHMWQMLVSLLEITAPDLSSDIRVAAGFCSEDADSGTIEAVFVLLGWGSSTRAVGKGRLLNGAAAMSFGTASTSLRSIVAPIVKIGNDANASAQSTVHTSSRALDAAGDCIINSHLGTGGEPTIVTGNWTPRPFLAAFRSSITDTTTRALSFKARRAAFTGQAVPLT